MEVYAMAETLTAPGRGIVQKCGGCEGTGVIAQGARACWDCEGTTYVVRRACPNCGNVAWDYRNGRHDADGMVCATGCGMSWTSEHPGWTIQVVPPELLAKAG